MPAEHHPSFGAICTTYKKAGLAEQQLNKPRRIKVLTYPTMESVSVTVTSGVNNAMALNAI